MVKSVFDSLLFLRPRAVKRSATVNILPLKGGHPLVLNSRTVHSYLKCHSASYCAMFAVYCMFCKYLLHRAVNISSRLCFEVWWLVVGYIRTEVVRTPVASTIWAIYHLKSVRACIKWHSAPPHRKISVFNTYCRTQHQIACSFLHNIYWLYPTNCKKINSFHILKICWISFLGKIFLCMYV